MSRTAPDRPSRPASRRPDRIEPRLDRIYDFYRDCLLNEFYYGHRQRQRQRLALALDLFVVLGTGASGVSGWIIWTRHPALGGLWAVAAALSTLLAALKPVLRMDEAITRYSGLFTGYRQLSVAMLEVIGDIRDDAGIRPETEKRVAALRRRYAELAKDDDPRPPAALVTRLQAEVEARIDWSAFYFPPPRAGGDDGE